MGAERIGLEWTGVDRSGQEVNGLANGSDRRGPEGTGRDRK